MTKIFEEISPKNKQKLLRFLEASTLTFEKNETILANLEQDNMIGMIVSGYIQIVRVDDEGNRTLIEELEEEDVFGSIISSIKNSDYNIITKEQTTIIIMDYDLILNYRENGKEFYNQFIKNLLKIVMQKIQEKNERIEILTKKSIRNKLLKYFSIMSKKRGSKHIYLPFSFTDLADYLAVDRSAMSRELKYLKEEGFIEVKGKKITLLYDMDSSIYV